MAEAAISMNNNNNENDDDDDQDDVKLRLGRVVYHTKRSVMLLARGSMLAAMFSHEDSMVAGDVDEDGAYMIQGRDPYLFGYILRFLEEEARDAVVNSSTESYSLSEHCSILHELSNKSLEDLQDEVKYFQIGTLQKKIQDELDSRRAEVFGRRQRSRIQERRIDDLRREKEFLQTRQTEQRQEIHDFRRRLQRQSSHNGCLIEVTKAKKGRSN